MADPEYQSTVAMDCSSLSSLMRQFYLLVSGYQQWLSAGEASVAASKSWQNCEHHSCSRGLTINIPRMSSGPLWQLELDLSHKRQ